MPAAVLPESAFKGRKVGDSFAPKKKGAGKGKGSGAPKKFTGKLGNMSRGNKAARRAQALTAPPMKIKGAAAKKPGTKKVVGHSMGGLFGVQPKRTEPENRPPKQSEKHADRAARIGRLKNLLI